MQARVNKILKSTLQDFSFSGTFTDMEEVTHNYTLFTDTQFRQIVKQMYGNRVYNDWDEDTELTDLVTDFIASFTAWKSARMDMYMGRLFALAQKYNPLENYRGYEKTERNLTHGESVELSFTNRKDIQKDDSFVEHTAVGYKETTKDDTFTERTFTDLKETTTDDTYTEHTYNNYKEKTTDDTYTEHTYTNYKETEGHGQQTRSHNISADDALTYVPESQDIDNTYDDTKEIEGSYKDQRGGTNGIEKTTTGSYKEENGCDNGIEKTTTGSYKDQNGFVSIGNEKSITGTMKDQHGQTQDGLTNEKTGKETTAHTGTDKETFELEKFGNLGVKTSQEILMSDMDLIRYDIVLAGIREFIDRFTYFSAEVE